MTTTLTDDLIPPGGMYARVPIPAVKKLIFGGERRAARVLVALCLHLGKGSQAVFPSYPTIALFSGISKNRIRESLDTLTNRGYIAIEKKRRGRKTQNHYSILPGAYLQVPVEQKRKVKPLDASQRWICHSCYEDVIPSEAEYITGFDFDGERDDRWIHKICTRPYDSRRVYPASPGLIQEQENKKRFRRNE